MVKLMSRLAAKSTKKSDGPVGKPTDLVRLEITISLSWAFALPHSYQSILDKYAYVATLKNIGKSYASVHSTDTTANREHIIILS